MFMYVALWQRKWRMNSLVSVRIQGLISHFLLKSILKKRARYSGQALPTRLSRCQLWSVSVCCCYKAALGSRSTEEKQVLSKPPIKPSEVRMSKKSSKNLALNRWSIKRKIYFICWLCGWNDFSFQERPNNLIYLPCFLAIAFSLIIVHCFNLDLY